MWTAGLIQLQIADPDCGTGPALIPGHLHSSGPWRQQQPPLLSVLDSQASFLYSLHLRQHDLHSLVASCGFAQDCFFFFAVAVKLSVSLLVELCQWFLVKFGCFISPALINKPFFVSVLTADSHCWLMPANEKHTQPGKWRFFYSYIFSFLLQSSVCPQLGSRRIPAALHRVMNSILPGGPPQTFVIKNFRSFNQPSAALNPKSAEQRAALPPAVRTPVPQQKNHDP